MQTIEWLGTAGFRIVFKNTVVLLDPFLSRPGFLRVMCNRLQSKEALCKELVPVADYILVGHSHYDHLLDVPTIAKQTDAKVYGSHSTAAVCLGANLPQNRIQIITPWQKYTCGEMQTTFVPSLHSRLLFGRVPFPGEIQEPVHPPLRASAYREGGTYGILVECESFRIYHCGSANLVDAEIERLGNVDILLLCLSGRRYTPNYLERLVGRLNPRLVIPHHYDNFFKPLTSNPPLLPGVHLQSFLTEMADLYPKIQVVLPKPDFSIQPI